MRDSDERDFLPKEKKEPRRRKDLMDGSDTIMAIANSAMDSTTAHQLAFGTHFALAVSTRQSHTNVGPRVDDLDRRKTNDAHGNCGCSEGKRHNETPDLPTLKLERMEKRKW